MRNPTGALGGCRVAGTGDRQPAGVCIASHSTARSMGGGASAHREKRGAAAGTILCSPRCCYHRTTRACVAGSWPRDARAGSFCQRPFLRKVPGAGNSAQKHSGLSRAPLLPLAPQLGGHKGCPILCSRSRADRGSSLPASSSSNSSRALASGAGVAPPLVRLGAIAALSDHRVGFMA